MEKINKLKYKLMELSEINPDYIDFYDIFVNEKDSIHVMTINDTTVENKPDAVLIHGLTGTSLQYFKCFKDLSQYMRIIAIDLPGMGLSNRVEVDVNKYDYTMTEEYFISRLHSTLTILGVEKFHFISHSFGGYISCLYAMNYKESVKSIILLSPVGISSHYIEVVSTNMEDMFQRVLYNLKKPPSYGYKIVGTFAKSFFERILTNKLKKLNNEEEGKVFSSIMQEMFQLKTTSENLIYKFFNGHIQAYKPICFYFESFYDIKIDFIYGDCDWNPIEHAEELKKLIPKQVDIHILNDAGHLLATDNPEGCSRQIIEILNKNLVISVNTKNTMELIIESNKDLNEILESNDTDRDNPIETKDNI